MREVETEAKSYIVDAVCPKCDKSSMRADNSLPTLWKSDPPHIPHVCKDDTCRYQEYFNQVYPYTKLRAR